MSEKWSNLSEGHGIAATWGESSVSVNVRFKIFKEEKTTFQSKLPGKSVCFCF